MFALVKRASLVALVASCRVSQVEAVDAEADAASGAQDGAAEADASEGSPLSPTDSGASPSPEQQAILVTLSPSALPPSPPDVSNRFADDPQAAALGKTLFFDPSFSGPLLDGDNDGSSETLGTVGQTGRVACAGCHLPSGGFSDTRSFQKQISLGAGWGRRRAPSLLNVGQARLLMWDGRRDSLYNQVFGPLETVVEMNSSRLFAAEQIFRLHQSDYEGVFGPMPPLADASQFPVLPASLTGCQPRVPTSPQPTCDGTFHGMPGDHAEFDGMTPANQAAVTQVVINAGKAIGAYERRLQCGAGRFDAWVQGDASALSSSEQRGALLFIGKAACVSCHSGPYLSDQEFHDVGLMPATVQQGFLDIDDPGAAAGIAALLSDPLNTAGAFSDGTDGRIPVAVTAAMEGAFRTPTLRCVSQRPTFMHTGQILSLAQVVAFFDSGGDTVGFPGTNELHSLGLTTQEQADLTAFLLALDGPVIAP